LRNALQARSCLACAFPGCATIYLRAVFLKMRRRRRVSLQAPRHVFGRVEDCARVVRQRKSVRRPYFGEYRRTSHRSPAPFGAAAFARFARESCLACQPKRPKSAKVGGARRDRTADLVNAIYYSPHCAQAFSHHLITHLYNFSFLC
jgi:hypothetical protein